MPELPEIPVCAECGETHEVMYIHSQCHIKVPVWVKLDQKHQMLILECSACGREVAKFALQKIVA